MEIQLQKLSSEKHRLIVIFPEGIQQSRDLETRSFLSHDFAHFALESVAGIQNGFWGMLATGANLQAAYATGEFIVPVDIELSAALIQSAFAQKFSREYAKAEIQKLSLPLVQSNTFDMIFNKLTALHGAWKGTRFGDAMKLYWPTN